MPQTTYQVVLAVDGRHSVSVTTDDLAAAKEAVAWADKAYKQLLERYGGKKEEASNQADEPAEDEVAPICEVHGVPMVRVHSKRGSFWSCHERMPDGSFCSYRPPRQ